MARAAMCVKVITDRVIEVGTVVSSITDTLYLDDAPKPRLHSQSLIGLEHFNVSKRLPGVQILSQPIVEIKLVLPIIDNQLDVVGVVISYSCNPWTGQLKNLCSVGNEF